MKLARFALLFCVAVVAVWVAVCAVVGIVAADMALHSARHRLGAADEARAEDVATRNGAALDEVAVTADDGAT